MKIELTEQEAASILELVDTGLKEHGIRALACANMVIGKINQAKQQEQNEKTTQLHPTAPSDTASQLG